ncbi:MAG: hypothetical protein K5871_09805 [Lachnospiraceae bacterium]|nr:hypothetical protein [Lachnospiraceae bacterium]
MKKNVNMNANTATENKTPRLILFLEKNADEGTYTYHVLTTGGLSYCPALTCDEESVKALPIVFNPVVSNLKVTEDGRVELGWPEGAMSFMEELIVNLHRSIMEEDANSEPDYTCYDDFRMEDEDEDGRDEESDEN